jgi:signal recognition particle GTPase
VVESWATQAQKHKKKRKKGEWRSAACKHLVEDICLLPATPYITTMVLAELGNKITNALRQMNNVTVIDEAAVDSMLKEIGNALVLADVNVPLVAKLKANIKKRISLEEVAAGLNKRKIIKQV